FRELVPLTMPTATIHPWSLMARASLRVMLREGSMRVFRSTMPWAVSQTKAWPERGPPEVPTAWPLLLVSRAALGVKPGSRPSEVIEPPCCQMKAMALLLASVEEPTTWPRLLMELPEESPPGAKVPRSVIWPLLMKKAWVWVSPWGVE